MTERRHVDKFGRGVNESGELLVPELGQTSKVYAELDRYHSSVLSEFARGNYTDPPIPEIIVAMKGFIGQLTDRGEIEEAQQTLAYVENRERTLRELPPDTRSPQLRKALRIMYDADKVRGPFKECLEAVSRAMDEAWDLVKDSDYRDQLTVQRHMPYLIQYATALRRVIARETGEVIRDPHEPDLPITPEEIDEYDQRDGEGDERRYLDDQGVPVNEHGQVLAPELGTTSRTYAELDRCYLAALRQAAKGNYTDPPIRDAVDIIESGITELTDRGEIEDANVMLDYVYDAMLDWEWSPPRAKTPGPELDKALRIIHRLDDGAATPTERLAMVEQAMSDARDAVKDSIARDRDIVLAKLAQVERYAEALRDVIDRQRAGEGASGRPRDGG